MKKLLVILVFTSLFSFAQDKATALPFKELLEIIPSEISGFSVTGEPDGMNMTMGDMSYSNGIKEFKKGDQSMSITVNDFIGYVSMYQASFGMSEGFSFEDADTKAYMETVNGIKSIISIDKKENTVSVVAGYKDRYLILIEVENSADESFAKSVLKKLSLNDLPYRISEVQDVKAWQ